MRAQKVEDKKLKSANDILKKRAIALSKPLIDDSKNQDDIVQLLMFKLGSQSYGVEINHVQEVSTYKEFTLLPKESSIILGLVNIRGRIFTIFNLKNLFNLSDDLAKTSGRVIILNSGDINLGISVDAINGVISCSSENIKSAVETLSAAEKDYICGVTSEGIGIISLENIVLERKKIIKKV